jgi:Beta propeller domain
MRRPAAVAAASLAALAIFAGAGATSAARDAKPKPERGFRLVRSASCDELVGEAKLHTRRLMRPWGLPRFPEQLPRSTSFEASRRRPGVDYSTTNVQEAGIDEPDIVKTDGSTVFFVRGNTLFAVDVDEGPLAVLGTLKLGSQVQELLLRGTRLLALGRRRYNAYQPMPGSPRRLPPYESARTVLTELDVRDPRAMRITRTLEVDGQYVSGRLHGRIARVVISSTMPTGLRFGESVEENRAIVSSAPLRHWLPRYDVRNEAGATRSRYLVQCRSVWRPKTFSGLGLLTVLTIDLDKGLEPTNAVSVLADGQILYASNDSLYLATEPWTARPRAWGSRPARTALTTIHKFGIASPDRTRYRASGTVPGFLVDQWSLSEHEGILRAVSTDTPLDVEDPETETIVTTLRERDGKLAHVGRVGAMGKGERLYAVRFMGDVGYVVTFRLIDPLYTLDLSEPERPRVVGELKIPGYSAYLHPVGEDLILGVGQAGDDSTNTRGLQVSLFDVENVRRPTRLDRTTVGRGWSSVEFDHHAFLYWPRTRLAVVPVGTQAVAVRVGRASGIRVAERIKHPTPYTDILRSLVVGDGLYTIAHDGIEERSLGTLRRRGWVEFLR